MSKTVTSKFVLKGDNRLNKSFAKARQQLAGLSRQAAMFGAIAAAAGVAVVRSQAKQIDVLAKTADALRISTESLQALQTMGELAGVGAEDLNKKLEKMQKNLGQMARQGGVMSEALSDVGLNIKDVIDLPADQQFEAVAGALAKMQNQTLRVSIASDLFGRNAGKLLKLTDELASKGLAGTRQELEQLGFAITRSQAAGVERMNDAMTIANKAATGLAQRMTIALAPAVAAIAEQFTESSKQSGGFADDVADDTERVAKAAGVVVDALAIVGRTFKLASKIGIVAFETLRLIIVDVADTIINGPNRAVNSLLELMNKIPGVDIDFKFNDAIVNFTEDINISKSVIKQALADIKNILLEPLPSVELEKRINAIREELANFQRDTRSGGNEDIVNGLQTLTPEQQKRNALEREYLSLINSTRTATEAHRAQITRIDELFISGVIPSAEAYTDILERVNQRFEDSKKQVEKLSEFATQAARNIQTSFADFLFGPFDKGLKGMLRGFADTVRRMVAEAAAANILKSLFGGSGGIAGFFSKALGLASASTGGGGGTIGSPMAKGGGVAANTAFLVGERGPEVIVPHSAGTVIPNNKIGGPNVTVNIDARQSDDPARLLALVPVIQSQVEQSLALKQRRGFA